MTTHRRIYSALLAGALALPACAQAQATPAAKSDGAPPSTIKVKARTNPGDLAYLWVFDHQTVLQHLLRLESARMVEFSWRITFTELNTVEQDEYLPKGWAVALVGNGWDQTVPVARGGYFLLPALPTGRQASTIMFREQSLPGYIGAAWRVKVGADGRLSYADFKAAMDEVHAAQDHIPLKDAGLDHVRLGKFDSIKACFRDAGGAVLVDGKPAADVSFGNCALLKFDPARAAGGQVIEFKGPLDVVTVVESQDYLALPPALAQAADVRPARSAEDGAKPQAIEPGPTNLSNLSYGWIFKRQQRLQDLPETQAKVNFVWRLSLQGMSEAERDAWTPQDWAVGLAGKGFARALPVARGGYFLLPALPAGRQDTTLIFKEHGRENVVEPAWVVRLRDVKHPYLEALRPYLFYGELMEVMNTVRKLQDTIPDEHAELAALRTARYDAIKACFLEPGGIVFVGDMPTADATVGNCSIVKFDPKQNRNEKIQFVGKLDAITLVESAPYLKAKS